MSIKTIFDEISNESSTNKKLEILKKHKNNVILQNVLYLIESPRVKFYIKQIPHYKFYSDTTDWDFNFQELKKIYTREVTGDKAKELLVKVLESNTKNNQYIIERIIEKDSKIGMGSTQVNKVWLKLIEDTPYQGAKPYSEKLANKILEKKRAISQIKADGRYSNVVVNNGVLFLESRQGEFTDLGNCKLVKELNANINSSFVLNGELTMDGIPRYESNGIIASIISINKKGKNPKDIIKFEKEHGDFQALSDKIILTCWDIIDYPEYLLGFSDTPYENRLKRLKTFIKAQNFDNIKLIESKIVTTLQEALDHFALALKNEEEGTILKSLEAPWKDGKPNWQIKLKLEMTVEMRIIDFHYGTKGTKNEFVISALEVASEESLVICKVPGIKEKDMLFITQNMDSLRGSIISVKCNGLSSNEKGEFSLLHPRLHEFRDDKKLANTYKEIVEIEKMKKLLV